MDDIVYLIRETWTQNSFGGQVPAEAKTAVWANIQSVTRAEWSEAGQAGLQPQMVAVTPLVNYHGEQIVELQNGKRLFVYRTYVRDDEIELYLEERAGVKNGQESAAGGAGA